MKWPQISKLTSEYKLLFIAAAFVVLICIFWPRPTNFSVGMSAHIGNLKGSVELEAFENSDKKTMVYFYAPWCNYCKKFMPIWDKFVQDNQSSTDVNLAKVDCTTDEELAKRCNISSFPTLKYFPQGLANVDVFQVFKRVGDNGSADYEALKQFLTKVSGTPDKRSNQAGAIDGKGLPVPADMAGNGIQTPGAFLANHFNEA